MDRHLKTPLKKASFLAAALLLAWGVQAQAQAQSSSTNNSTDSTHHQYGMHHRWNHNSNNGSDSTHHGYAHDGFGPGARGGFGHDHWNKDHDGWNRDRWNRSYAHRGFEGHRPGARFGHDRQRGNGIHYTPDQRKQLMAINKEYREKAQDLYKQDNLTLKQYKAGLLALQKDRKDKAAALLTPQQKDQLAARRKRMDENRQVAQAAHLERLRLRLNLTDDQVARIKAGQNDLHNQVKAIHENNDLLPQQKHEQMKALLAKRNDTYKTVLTPEQYSQFEKMHSRGFGPGHDGFGRPGSFGHDNPGRPDGGDREI